MKKTVGKLIKHIVIFTLLVVIVLFSNQRYQSYKYSQGFHINVTSLQYINKNLTTEELKGLSTVLERASLPDNKTVILAPLNSAWANFFELFIESFHEGNGTRYLLNHTIIIGLDKGAFELCKQRHPHCFQLKMEGLDLSGEQRYMTKHYVFMNKRRLYLQGVILELGYNFIFSDMDILWFRPPFEHFSEDADMELACDSYTGDELDMKNQPNMGFVHVRSNNRTVQLFKYWDEQNAIYMETHEQNVFNIFKNKPEFLDIGVKLRFMSPDYFGGFCTQANKKVDLDRVCTMHANCCIGKDNKINDLKLTMEDWKSYKSSLTRQGIQFRAPQMC